MSSQPRTLVPPSGSSWFSLCSLFLFRVVRSGMIYGIGPAGQAGDRGYKVSCCLGSTLITPPRPRPYNAL